MYILCHNNRQPTLHRNYLYITFQSPILSAEVIFNLYIDALLATKQQPKETQKGSPLPVWKNSAHPAQCVSQVHMWISQKSNNRVHQKFQNCIDPMFCIYDLFQHLYYTLTKGQSLKK